MLFFPRLAETIARRVLASVVFRDEIVARGVYSRVRIEGGIRVGVRRVSRLRKELEVEKEVGRWNFNVCSFVKLGI